MLETWDALFYPPDLGNTGTTCPLQPFRPQLYWPRAEMPPAGPQAPGQRSVPVPSLCHACVHADTDT